MRSLLFNLTNAQLLIWISYHHVHTHTTIRSHSQQLTDFFIGQGKKGQALIKHGVDTFGNDNENMIQLLFTYGGLNKKTEGKPEKIEFKEFLSLFNRYSRHVSGHNKSLKDRIGWIWDFFCYVGNPKTNGAQVKFLKKEGLLPILKVIDPDGEHNLDTAQAVIEEMIGQGVETVDRGSFIQYIGECIPDCNTFMEIDYDDAYGVGEEDKKKEKALFEDDTKNNKLGDFSNDHIEADSNTSNWRKLLNVNLNS